MTVCISQPRLYNDHSSALYFLKLKAGWSSQKSKGDSGGASGEHEFLLGQVLDGQMQA
jgi:hypothetical protein